VDLCSRLDHGWPARPKLLLKSKMVPLRSIEAHLGDRRYSAYSFLTSALEGGEWSASRPGRALAPGKEPPVPTVQEAGWAPEAVWTQRLEDKSSVPVGDRTPAKLLLTAANSNSVFTSDGRKHRGHSSTSRVTHSTLALYPGSCSSDRTSTTLKVSRNFPGACRNMSEWYHKIRQSRFFPHHYELSALSYLVICHSRA
jgi:hypothetical protein